MNRSVNRLVGRVVVLAVVLGLWQAASVTGYLRADEFPSMTRTAAALGREFGQVGFWVDLWATVRAWAAGVAIGAGSAVLVGSLLGLNRFAHRSASPVIELFKTVPVVAILPLAILVFGATLRMRYVLVAFGVFWPLTIQVIYGVRSVDPTVRDTAEVLRVRGLRRFAVVTLPSAAPFVATGLRVAAATGLILDIVAELIGGGEHGLGLGILNALNAGPDAYPTMYAFIVATGLLGVVLTGAFGLAERRVLHWHESQRGTGAAGTRRPGRATGRDVEAVSGATR